MNDCKRSGKRWTTSEILNLQREYELLNLSVQEIAKKHQRSVDSILFKLNAEGLIDSLYEINVDKKKDKKKKEDDIESSSDYKGEVDISEYDEKDDSVCLECNLDNLSERVWSLETSVGEINAMVKQMFDKMTMEKKSKKKLAPLRKAHV
jgi:hypothetical protein